MQRPRIGSSSRGCQRHGRTRNQRQGLRLKIGSPQGHPCCKLDVLPGRCPAMLAEWRGVRRVAPAPYLHGGPAQYRRAIFPAASWQCTVWSPQPIRRGESPAWRGLPFMRVNCHLRVRTCTPVKSIASLGPLGTQPLATTADLRSQQRGLPGRCRTAGALWPCTVLAGMTARTRTWEGGT